MNLSPWLFIAHLIVEGGKEKEHFLFSLSPLQGAVQIGYMAVKGSEGLYYIEVSKKAAKHEV